MKKWQDAMIFSFFPSAAAARMAVANVRMSYWLRNPSTSPIEKKALLNSALTTFVVTLPRSLVEKVKALL